MTDTVVIRKECPADYADISELVRSAFLTAERSDGTEHELVDRLRKSAEYIPDLALVAESGGRTVGYLMMTSIKIGGSTGAVALAPLAVSERFRGLGIGRKLIAEAHSCARSLGYCCSVVLGSPAYYSGSGYVSASLYGIKAPFDVPEPFYMVYPLIHDAHLPAGEVSYSAAFGL